MQVRWLKPALLWCTLLLVFFVLSGCAAANSAMGGNERKSALAEVEWSYAKDGVLLEISADHLLNQYAGEPHTVVLGIYQMEDAALFYKLIASTDLLSKSLASNLGNDGFLQFTRYVVEPGKRAILVMDRAQKSKFLGVAAGYYHMGASRSARLFEIPLSVASSGLVAKTWKAEPVQLAVRLALGADGIINAERLNYDPSEKKKQQAVPLDGGGKEILLGTAESSVAIQGALGLKKIED